ncbi:MAG: DUF917 family protein [Bacillota bacterium]
MRGRKLTPEDIPAAVRGGAILGGGGGGGLQLGLELAEMALSAGDLFLVPPEQVSPELTVITCSLVGAPAATRARVLPDDFLRAVRLLMDVAGLRAEEVGLISNENGAAATVNGWFQAAALGLPLVDIPCNGRAHPLGIMGAMGLERCEGYRSLQVAVGGDRSAGAHLEMTVSAAPGAASALIREAADRAGGLVAVARNPVSAAHALEHGAPGAISQAIDVGRAWLEADPGARVAGAAEVLGGFHAGSGVLQAVEIETRGGFDVGLAVVTTGDGQLDIPILNEYMALRAASGQLAVFPDLVNVFDSDCRPLSSAELGDRVGERVDVTWVPRENLRLGSGARDAAHLDECERLLGVKLR